MTLTIKLDGNWSSFQLANSAPPLSVTGSAIAPSARIPLADREAQKGQREYRHAGQANNQGSVQTVPLPGSLVDGPVVP